MAVLVEPEKPLNLGLIARLTDNFRIDKLRLVNSKLTSEQWRDAKVFSSHSASRLEEAKRHHSLRKAISDVDLSIATSAQDATTSSNIIRRSINLKDLRTILQDAEGEVALVFGRDGTGLTNEEVKMCDLLLSIHSSPEYKALNIACAAAIVFHRVYLTRIKGAGVKPLLDRSLKDRVIEQFQRTALYSGTKPHRVERAVKAFTHAVNRSQLVQREATLILGVLRRASNRLEKVSWKTSM